MTAHGQPLLDGNVERFGSRLLGPYLVSFCDWLHDRQRTLGENTCLLFVARDGFLPHLVYRALYPSEAHQCHYLVASRVAAQLCTIADETSAAAWLRRARTSAGLVDLLQAAAGSPAPEGASFGPRDLLDLARRHRSAYRAHVLEKLSDQPALIVDIGYGGSAQANLVQLLNRTVHGAYFVTHRSARATASEAGSVQSFDASFLTPHARTGLVNPQRYFFETVLSEPKGSFLCFAAPDRPVFEPFASEETTAGVLRQIRRGVERHARETAPEHRARAEPQAAREALRDFLANPHPDDAKQFAGLAFDDRLKGVTQRYIVIPPEQRADAFALWAEGQRAVDLTTAPIRERGPWPPWRRLEDRLMRRGLSTAQYACYATNRTMFVKACGGVGGLYGKACKTLAERAFERRLPVD